MMISTVVEGYYADLILVDFDRPTRVSHEKGRYYCG